MDNMTILFQRLTRGSLAVLVLLASLGTAGCNTVAGAGEDLQSAGEAVENAAERNKKK